MMYTNILSRTDPFSFELLYLLEILFSDVIFAVYSVNFKQKLPHYKKCLDSPSSPLKFRTEEWCIKIHKPGVNSADNFPRVVR